MLSINCFLRNLSFLAIILINTKIGYANPVQDQPIVRGKYLFTSAGCSGCHTSNKKNKDVLGGGKAITTSFGTWSDSDFINAMREGISPQGTHYFPVFPYTSYSKMTNKDILDIKNYIFSLSPSAKRNLPHKIRFPFKFRKSMFLWKLLYFKKGAIVSNPNKETQWNRGSYLANAVFHCGECHTPRNYLGALISEKHFAGTLGGLRANVIPNITPDTDTGIGNWSERQITDFLTFGMLPDGDFVADDMVEVSNNISKLNKKDINALVIYLRAIPGIRNKVKN